MSSSPSLQEGGSLSPQDPQLPDAVIERILRYMPMSSRLTTCATVCKAWAAAAVRVTSSVQCGGQQWDPEHMLPHLQSWLSNPEQQLTSLRIAPQDDGPVDPYRPNTGLLGMLQLPHAKLAQLQELSLERLEIKLAPSAAVSRAGALDSRPPQRGAARSNASTQPNASGALSLLPALKHLDLQHCTLDKVSNLVLLAQSPALTSLQLLGIKSRDTPVVTTWSPWRADYSAHFSSAIASLLEGLPGLQVLSVQAAQLPALRALGSDPNLLQPTALSSTTAMSGLQDLSLSFGSMDAQDEWPTALPHGLTRFEMGVRGMVYGGGLMHQPHIQACLKNVQHMQRLQELKLQLCDFDPSLLSSITGLRKLHLASCVLLPGERAGTRALLSALQGLTQLEAIHLSAKCQCSYEADVVPLELFAALTASPQLTSLEICYEDVQPLTRGAVQRMFPLGRSMPQLQVLRIRDQYYKRGERNAWCVGGRDIADIASACPGLRELELMRVVRPGATFDGLQQMPDSLTSLTIGGPAFDDAAAAEVAQLVQLQSLSVDHAPEFTAVGFEGLTALIGLTRLHHRGDACGWENAFFGEHIPVLQTRDMQLSIEKGPIWQQVQDFCEQLPAAQAEADMQADIDAAQPMLPRQVWVLGDDFPGLG